MTELTNIEKGYLYACSYLIMALIIIFISEDIIPTIISILFFFIGIHIALNTRKIEKNIDKDN